MVHGVSKSKKKQLKTVKNSQWTKNIKKQPKNGSHFSKMVPIPHSPNPPIPHIPKFPYPPKPQSPNPPILQHFIAIMKTGSELSVWYYGFEKYLGKKQYFLVNLPHTNKIYPQTSVVLKYDAIYSNNKVRVQTSKLTPCLLLVHLSSRVASP